MLKSGVKNLVVYELKVNGVTKMIMARPEDKEMVFYDITVPKDADIFLKLPLPNQKLWSVDSYFCQNVLDAYAKRDSNIVAEQK